MLQIKTFQLPEEEKEANAFLAANKPAGPMTFVQKMLVVPFDDGVVTPGAKIADLRELIKASHNVDFNSELMMHVMQVERADLNPIHAKQKDRQVELDSGINKIKTNMTNEAIKRAFVEARIEELNKEPDATKAANKGGNEAQA